MGADNGGDGANVRQYNGDVPHKKINTFIVEYYKRFQVLYALHSGQIG